MRHIEVEGLRLLRIGLGTSQVGTREWGDGEASEHTVAPRGRAPLSVGAVPPRRATVVLCTGRHAARAPA